MQYKLVMFSSKHCVPCFQAKNFLKGLNVKYQEYDVENHEKLLSQYDVQSVPTFYIVDENENIIESLIGFSTQKLVELLRKYKIIK